ncbi:MAG: outer membrane protein transport protein [Nitrospirae bacterium]|nr:outer membrane protein transport protein [Nitrospirota bacterium]
MKKLILLLITLLLVLTSLGVAFATNGDNLIGIGPISRAMGGVGVASPQDAISALYGNPSSLNCSGSCPGSEVDFGGTLFIPTPSTSVNVGTNGNSANSASKVYPIPSFGLAVPLADQWRFGIAAYGVAGLGVDYRNSAIDRPNYYDFSTLYGKPAGTITYPLSGAQFSQFSMLQISPAVSYSPTKDFSIGVAAKINYGTLDFGAGSSTGYGLGAQLGLTYRPIDMVSLGLVYTSPIPTTYKSLYDFSGTGTKNDMKLEAPQQIALGVSVEPVKDTFLLETDVKWINWADADGYKDFDWKNQWVLGVGAQFKPVKGFALRAGYDYGKNPVNLHNNFVGASMASLQGHSMPAYYFENFRIVGFPALVEHHLTLGFGYDFSTRFALNVGYMHAFSNSLTENGVNMMGTPVALTSKLSEDSIEFGLTWKF